MERVVKPQKELVPVNKNYSSDTLKRIIRFHDRIEVAGKRMAEFLARALVADVQ